MTTIRVKENEPFEVALRRFKRTIEKTGLLTELRAREFYEKPTMERKRKLAAEGLFDAARGVLELPGRISDRIRRGGVIAKRASPHRQGGASFADCAQ